MPKNKKKDSSDDSDSGPEDRNPPSSKKSKQTNDSDSGAEERKPPPSKKSKQTNSSSKSNNEEEESWSLGKNKFIKVREFKGRLFVDIREYYDADGELKPGKKGISLTTEQWKLLTSLQDDVNDAIKRKA